VQCKMLIFNSIDGMRGTECRGLREWGRGTSGDPGTSAEPCQAADSTGIVLECCERFDSIEFFLILPCLSGKVFP